MSKIYLVRHGDYDHKTGGLTPKGADQATSIGIFLGKREAGRIILTSPYPRTVQTARHISSYVRCIDLVETKLLREFTGQGEEWLEMASRALIAMNMAIGAKNCDVIVVSHQAVLQVMIAEITGKDAKSIRIPKGALYEIDAKTFIRIHDFERTR
jgi:broad specificity phosphatase PhoE